MSNSSSNHQIRMGMVLSYATIVLGIITGLVYTPWMLSELGSSDYGVYTIANNVISILLMDFGLSLAVTRYTARYLECGEIDALRSFYGVINKLYFIIDCAILLVFGVVLILMPVFYKALSGDEVFKLRIIFAVLAFYSILSFQFIPSDGILTAYEEFVASKACVLIVKFLTVVTTAVFLYLGYGLYAIVGSHIVFGSGGVLFKKLYITYHLKLKPKYKTKREISYKELGAFSGWITVIQLGDRLFLGIIPTILGAVSGSFETAVFGIAITLESFVFSIVSAANNLFFPRVSRTYNADDENHSDTMTLLIRVGKFQTFVGGLIVCGFAAIGRSFIRIWSSSEYSAAFWATLLIIIPVCIEQAQGVALLVMQVSGKLKQIALAQIVCGVINVVATVILGKQFGAIGGAIALIASKTIKIAYDNIVFQKSAGLNMAKYYKKVVIPFSPSFFATIGLGYLLERFGFIKGWLNLLLSIGVLTIAFTVFALIFVFDSEEKKMVLDYLKKFKLKKRKTK